MSQSWSATWSPVLMTWQRSGTLHILGLLLCAAAFGPSGACGCSHMRALKSLDDLGVLNLDDPDARWEAAFSGAHAPPHRPHHPHHRRHHRRLQQAPLTGQYRGQSGGIPKNSTANGVQFQENVAVRTNFSGPTRRPFLPYPDFNRAYFATRYELKNSTPDTVYNSTQRACIIKQARIQANYIYNLPLSLAAGQGFHAANFVRLAFHDCAGGGATIAVLQGGEERLVTVGGGCDGSLLLAPEELATVFNYNLQDFKDILVNRWVISVRCGFYFSTADAIQTMAGAFLELVGGPKVLEDMHFGRADRGGLPNDSNKIPHMTDNFKVIVEKFQGILGTSPTFADDMVALMGAHTLGEVRCFFLIERLRNPATRQLQWDPQMNSATLRRIQTEGCGKLFYPGTSTLIVDDVAGTRFTDVLEEVAFDTTRLRFDNLQMKFMQNATALIRTDNFIQRDDGSGVSRTRKRDLRSSLNRFASDPSAFSSAFKAAFLRLGMTGVTRP